jgi:hypothetical protein
MDTFEYYRDLYKTEWDYRQTLNGAAAVPIGALTVLGGLLAFIAREADFSQPVIGAIVAVTGLAAVAAFAVATYKVVRALHGYKYARVPFSDDLRTWEQQVRVAIPNSAQADAAFFAKLSNRYAEAAGENGRLNAQRSNFFYLANRWVVYTLVASAVAGIGAVVGKRVAPPVVPVVRIIQAERIDHMTDTVVQQPVATPPASNPVHHNEPQPVIPEPPPNIHVRTDLAEPPVRTQPKPWEP